MLKDVISGNQAYFIPGFDPPAFGRITLGYFGAGGGGGVEVDVDAVFPATDLGPVN